MRPQKSLFWMTPIEEVPLCLKAQWRTYESSVYELFPVCFGLGFLSLSVFLVFFSPVDLSTMLKWTLLRMMLLLWMTKVTLQGGSGKDAWWENNAHNYLKSVWIWLLFCFLRSFSLKLLRNKLGLWPVLGVELISIKTSEMLSEKYFPFIQKWPEKGISHWML